MEKGINNNQLISDFELAMVELSIRGNDVTEAMIEVEARLFLRDQKRLGKFVPTGIERVLVYAGKKAIESNLRKKVA